MNETKSSKLKIKIGILFSVSLQMFVMGIAVTIPSLMKEFPTVSPALVQSIITIPSLVSVPISLIVSPISVKYGKKKFLLAGIILLTIGGIMPALLNVNFNSLVMCMIIVGLGGGCIIPTATGLIPDFFEGDERGAMMGLQASAVNLGSMVASFIAGRLAVASWRNSFFIFIYPIIVFFIALICIPNTKPQVVTATDNKPREKAKLSEEFYVIGAIIVVFCLFYAIVNGNNALLITDKGFGDSRTAGNVNSLRSGIGVLTGFVFGKIVAKLKTKTLPIGLFMLGISMLLTANTPTMALFYITSALLGFSLSITMPSGMLRATNSVDKNSTTLAVSVFTALTNVSFFISPFIMIPLSERISTGTAQSRFIIGGIALVILGVIAYFVLGRNKKVAE